MIKEMSFPMASAASEISSKIEEKGEVLHFLDLLKNQIITTCNAGYNYMAFNCTVCDITMSDFKKGIESVKKSLEEGGYLVNIVAISDIKTQISAILDINWDPKEVVEIDPVISKSKTIH